MGAHLQEAYRLVEAPPSVEAYLALRERSGLTPKTRDQAVAALQGSWAACHVVHEAGGETVGMGRVLGDGGWYFHIVDMAVLPDHQRRGLGDAILTWLLDRIRTQAPPGRLGEPARRSARAPPLRPPRLHRDRPALHRDGAADGVSPAPPPRSTSPSPMARRDQGSSRRRAQVSGLRSADP
jgi:GNAT superfamily N-acetyltransferase